MGRSFRPNPISISRHPDAIRGYGICGSRLCSNRGVCRPGHGGLVPHHTAGAPRSAAVLTRYDSDPSTRIDASRAMVGTNRYPRKLPTTDERIWLRCGPLLGRIEHSLYRRESLTLRSPRLDRSNPHSPTTAPNIQRIGMESMHTVTNNKPTKATLTLAMVEPET